jgi:hypothetical protein
LHLGIVAMIVRLIAACASLLLTSAISFAASVDRVDIVEYGIFSGPSGPRTKNSNTVSGYTTASTDLNLVSPTEAVPARLGVRFGIKYVIIGSPQGGRVKLTWLTRFPPGGLTNPRGRHFRDNKFTQAAKIGVPTYRTFSFDEAWEAVPGDWIFEFYYKGRKVGEKKFSVVKE